MKTLMIAAIVAVMALLASTASAQGFSNPTTIQFQPSTDHNVLVAPGGASMVTRYDVEIFLVGSSSPVKVVNIGKPVPDAANNNIIGPITIPDFTLVVDGNYVVDVVTVGPTGVGRSSTVPFVRQRPITRPPAAPFGIVLQ